MTKQPVLDNRTHDNNHHGSFSSYIIGFLLSLILSAIAYYAVTRQVIPDRTLLVSILALAIAQMLVQIFFFLHLGRGPKPFYNIVFFVATAAFITVITGASIFIMDNLYRNMSPEEVTRRLAQDENIAEIGGKQTGACSINKQNHVMTITRSSVTPNHISAKHCDTISFQSGDGSSYKLMFGPHDTPTSYGGLYEIHVRGNRAEVVTLNETGTFNFHDAANHDITGIFIVEPEQP